MCEADLSFPRLDWAKALVLVADRSNSGTRHTNTGQTGGLKPLSFMIAVLLTGGRTPPVLLDFLSNGPIVFPFQNTPPISTS